MTALQPPPPSPTHSVNPDHTLHAENRTTDPPYGRRPDWRDSVLFSACGQEIFVAGDFNHVASAATATAEYPAATAATNTACPTSSCRLTRTRPLAAPLHPHTTPASTAPPTRPAPITTGSDAPARAHAASHRVPTRLCLPITLWFGPNPTQRNVVCGNLFVRYISIKLRPTPAAFIAVPTTFPRPNWSQRHPAIPPTHAPTVPPPTPLATTALLLRLSATFSRLTEAAATASHLVMEPPPQPRWTQRRWLPTPNSDAPGARICLPDRNKWWS